MRITDVRIYGVIEKESPEMVKDEKIDSLFEKFEQYCRESSIFPNRFNLAVDYDVINEDKDGILISILFQ